MRIVALLEKMYNEKATYAVEYKPDWLTCVPTNKMLGNYSTRLKECYSELTDNKLDLIEGIATKLKPGQQSFDIWIDNPYNFAVEFDEKQHFNQFRLKTLNYYSGINIGYDIQYYKELNDKISNPSTGGFTKLRSPDTLFPEFLIGDKQDNRTRQRAFRDMLKDLMPLDMGYNKTIRIPYHITSKRIKNFTELDLENVSKYLLKNEILKDLKLTSSQL